MDKSTLQGLGLVLMVSASLTLPWLFTSVFGRRRGLHTSSPATIATADRMLARFRSWGAMEAAGVTGEGGIARVNLAPSAERGN